MLMTEVVAQATVLYSWPAKKETKALRMLVNAVKMKMASRGHPRGWAVVHSVPGYSAETETETCCR